LSNSQTSKTLRTLPREKAFYFFTSIGNYTGKSATSLEEFAKEILNVNIKSLEFHLYRDDFEKWIAQTLEDSNLANKIKQLKALKPIGIDLRDRLYLIVSKHYENLKTPPHPTTTQTSTKPTYTKPKTTTITFGKTQPENTVETQVKE